MNDDGAVLCLFVGCLTHSVPICPSMCAHRAPYDPCVHLLSFIVLGVSSSVKMINLKILYYIGYNYNIY